MPDGSADGSGADTGADGPGRGDNCPMGKKTTVSGKVYAPSPVMSPDPIPNVAVYVPAGALAPFPAGVSCLRCGEEAASLARTVSKSDGAFMLENVPPGKDVTIVLQAGRWRRTISVQVTACQDNPLPMSSTRLPRNASEGDIPKMALQTGAVDGLECLLAKILDPAEITAPSGSGRVHLYRGNGADMSSPLPPSSDLWGTLGTISQYDLVFFPCDFGSTITEPAIPQNGVTNVQSYLDVGGRVFLTHGGGKWLKENSPTPYPNLIQFNVQPDPPSPLSSLVDMSFPKGKIFAEWLLATGVSKKLGEVDVVSPQWYVDGVSAPARTWIASTSPVTVQHFTFNLPIAAPDDKKCGRALFSNFHVKQPPSNAQFPAHCTDVKDPLTTNEKIIEYMLFDTSGCVQPDSQPPK
jgi:hypothetical protein